MVLAFLVPYLSSSIDSVIAEVETDPILPSYVVNAEPLFITSDLELSAAAAGVGSGTSGDPYIIQDLIISDVDWDGIYISGTTDYFKILNCTITTPNTYGIYIYNVADDTANIYNCTITGGVQSGIFIQNSNYSNIYYNEIDSCTTSGAAGIKLTGCYQADVYYNNVTTCWRGIEVSSSYHSYIYYNYVHDNTDIGILAESSNEVVIQYCTSNNNLQGIQVYSCYDPFVGNNWVSDTEEYGIYIRYSDYARVGGNNFHGCGLGVFDVYEADLLTLQITSNYIDGSLIYYGENVTDTNIWVRYSQFILVNCSNVQISSQDQLASSLYVVIGIYFCDNIDVRFSYVNDGYHGIYFYESDVTRIYNNTLHNNDIAIIGYTSTLGFIRENEIYNGFHAIYFLYGVHNYSVYENNIQTMTGYGISLLDSNYNAVFHNNLVNGGGSITSYGYDSGIGNYWHNASLLTGNYWSNWVSGSYAIDGPSGSFDYFPLSTPYTPPPIVLEYIYLNWFAVIFLSIIPAMGIYLKKRK